MRKDAQTVLTFICWINFSVTPVWCQGRVQEILERKSPDIAKQLKSLAPELEQAGISLTGSQSSLQAAKQKFLNKMSSADRQRLSEMEKTISQTPKIVMQPPSGLNFPIYKGTNSQYAESDVGSDDISGLTIVTADDVTRVSSWYRSSLRSDGWTVRESNQANAAMRARGWSQQVMECRKGDWDGTFKIYGSSNARPTTTVSIMVYKHIDEVPTR
ncbi:MAG: hypothetical protein K2X77_09890 [Candidatus Obscuribacterales bacterium]|nr:hypothetical protein [Candidatus Obscuribacterales bacterium]